MKNAILMLESGKTFYGNSFGADGETAGEVVFNTGMTGYQEILTDPSYCGQIVTMTSVHIGNYGTNQEDIESRKPFVEGFIVRENSNIVSNWRSTKTLSQYLKDNKIVAIEGIDTRALTKHLREKGAMKGIISTTEFNVKNLKRKLSSVPGLVGVDLVKRVTCGSIHKSIFHKEQPGLIKIVAIDSGIKYNIERCLSERKFDVTVVPASTPYKEIMNLKPEGIFLSNGPGDPEAVTYLVDTVKQLITAKIPVFGICLGHQMLGLALGGKTYKLKFGHHGINHPVKNLKTGKIEITSQNHGFCVKMLRIHEHQWVLDGNADVEITHMNLNDMTCEGLRHKQLPVFSVQYHPEAAPGPFDSRYLFDDFVKLIKEKK